MVLFHLFLYKSTSTAPEFDAWDGAAFNIHWSLLREGDRGLGKQYGLNGSVI